VTIRRSTSESFMKTSASLLQCGHRTRPVRSGLIGTSRSQALHLKCMIGSMKTLAVVLLMAITVQAQTVADVARKERERRAQLRSVRVLTIESVQPSAPAVEPAQPKAADTPPPPEPGAPVSVPAVSVPAQAPPKLAPPPPPPVPVVDATARWNEEMNQARGKVQELQRQEAALQLQINQLTNQFFAPVSDQSSRDQAQARLGETQNQLMAVRVELDKAKKTLDSLQLQGPPKQ
jgi:type IV secretory pathway VirB10-like protein